MLAVGDSLTAAIPGASHVKLLKKMQNTYSVIAKGRGGNTLYSKTIEMVKQHEVVKLVSV